MTRNDIFVHSPLHDDIEEEEGEQEEVAEADGLVGTEGHQQSMGMASEGGNQEEGCQGIERDTAGNERAREQEEMERNAEVMQCDMLPEDTEDGGHRDEEHQHVQSSVFEGGEHADIQVSTANALMKMSK